MRTLFIKNLQPPIDRADLTALFHELGFEWVRAKVYDQKPSGAPGDGLARCFVQLSTDEDAAQAKILLEKEGFIVEFARAELKSDQHRESVKARQQALQDRVRCRLNQAAAQ